MLRILHVLSVVTKFIFYGLMVYFLVLVAGILSGSYRFTETNTTFYYMVLTSSVAFVSLFLHDLHDFLAKKRSGKGIMVEESDTEDEHDPGNE